MAALVGEWASGPGAACQACPGMAIFLTEAMTAPAGVFKTGYRPIPSEFRSGISPSLDTPPPRPAFVV
ncbi:MAG: hypothetical protein OEL53_03690 [Rhodospirillales bacterium]|nr:hypothetical protein [Rhodospirillales bacterium]